MKFVTDQQTLQDLNLLGKYRPNSVYSFFNRMKTAGGEKLLEQMFRQPLSNDQEINKRCILFRYFQNKKLQFPFDPIVFAEMENYLSTSEVGNPIVLGAAIIKQKITAVALGDKDYEKLKQGLSAAQNIFSKLEIFVSKFETKAQHPYQKELRTMVQLLENRNMIGFLEQDFSEDISLFQLIKYQFFLKKKLYHQVHETLKMIYHLDVCITVSEIAERENLVYAAALSKTDRNFFAKELRHPCLAGAKGNTITFNGNKNVLFLTGANMAGKSTLMKTVGVAIYLAHMGFPVAAEEMEFSVREGIFTSINVADNITLGYSHFYAEVLRVKQVAEEVSTGKNLLVIFDELFKGTNVKDAFDATLSVTKAFAMHDNSIFIISTHITEVGEELAKQNSDIQFRYLPTVMNGTIPIYTYQLTDGITDDRHGMLILKNEKILEIINGDVN